MYHPEVFYKKRVLKHFVKSTETHLCLRLFFDKVAIKWPITMVGLKVFFNSFFKVAFSRSQVLEISGEILKISLDFP